MQVGDFLLLLFFVNKFKTTYDTQWQYAPTVVLIHSKPYCEGPIFVCTPTRCVSIRTLIQKIIWIDYIEKIAQRITTTTKKRENKFKMKVTNESLLAQWLVWFWKESLAQLPNFRSICTICEPYWLDSFSHSSLLAMFMASTSSHRCSSTPPPPPQTIQGLTFSDGYKNTIAIFYYS